MTNAESINAACLYSFFDFLSFFTSETIAATSSTENVPSSSWSYFFIRVRKDASLMDHESAGKGCSPAFLFLSA